MEILLNSFSIFNFWQKFYKIVLYLLKMLVFSKKNTSIIFLESLKLQYIVFKNNKDKRIITICGFLMTIWRGNFYEMSFL